MNNKEAIRILKHLRSCQYLPDDYSLEDENTDQAYDLAIEALEDRPTGEWIEMSDNYGHSSYFCSRCGTQEGKPYDYCPNCGAKMKAEKEAENGSSIEDRG